MVKKFNVPLEERTKPFGTVLRHEKLRPDIPVRTFDYKLKMWLVTNVMEDNTQVVADDFEHIPDGCCRRCKKVIEPYSNKYYEKRLDNGYEHCFEYSQEVGYCESCAKEITATATFIQDCPDIVRREQHLIDGQMLETVVYADGSTVEELTAHELARHSH